MKIMRTVGKVYGVISGPFQDVQLSFETRQKIRNKVKEMKESFLDGMDEGRDNYDKYVAEREQKQLAQQEVV